MKTINVLLCLEFDVQDTSLGLLFSSVLVFCRRIQGIRELVHVRLLTVGGRTAIKVWNIAVQVGQNTIASFIDAIDSENGHFLAACQRLFHWRTFIKVEIDLLKD